MSDATTGILFWLLVACFCFYQAYEITQQPDVLIPSNAHHYPDSPTEEERSHGYEEFNNEQ